MNWEADWASNGSGNGHCSSGQILSQPKQIRVVPREWLVSNMGRGEKKISLTLSCTPADTYLVLDAELTTQPAWSSPG